MTLRCQSFFPYYSRYYTDFSHRVKKDVWNDCFNLGYEDGEASGCNAASGNNGKRGGPVSE
jgi:hypothetical protein